MKKKTKEELWENHLFQKYGLTRKQYEQMYNDQRECCAICGVHSSNTRNGLFVDHCHITLKVRGLLCTNCNTTLGRCKDSVERLEAMLTYLKRNS